MLVYIQSMRLQALKVLGFRGAPVTAVLHPRDVGFCCGEVRTQTPLKDPKNGTPKKMTPISTLQETRGLVGGSIFWVL